ncbi:MAG: hypothetical protein LQ338_003188 [Usnochroma carphineum]|nr:MAG: hypothetical protein LQ338_003188 [Usnochroma carphineum]
MAWKETKPGTHQRPLGDNEKFIKLIGDRAHAVGREHWSVTSKAKFELTQPLEESELTRLCYIAWIALRFKHPSIASTADAETLTYVVPDQDSLRAWAGETFISHAADVSTDDLIATLTPSRYATAHLVTAECAILLHLPHWRTDGYGALNLLDEYLDRLAYTITEGASSIDEMQWASETSRLVPSLEEALKLPAKATPEVEQSAKKYLSTAALFQDAVGVEVPVDVEPKTLPRGTRSARVRFTEAETQALLQACKAKHISLDASIHATCCAVTYTEAAAAAQDRPYTSTMRFSMRPHMPRPYNGPQGAAGLYTGGYMIQVPAFRSWTENAKQYNTEYRLGVTPDFLNCRREYGKKALEMLSQKPPPPAPLSSEIDISSVGDAEKLVFACHMGSDSRCVLEIRDLSIGVETLSRQMYCFLWTFRGQLEFNLVYNEAFHSADQASQLVQRMRKVLMTELGCG